MSGFINPPPNWPPSGPTTIQTTIPSYPYAQYSDDDGIQQFVAAYNVMGQGWVDAFNQLNLPVYSLLSGQLLDWVAQGLYGLARPILSLQQKVSSQSGPYNSIEYDRIPYDAGLVIGPVAGSYLLVNDDQFKRMITWHVYKGDGFQFSTRWLKRRVHRFINGANGTDASDNTFDVSITYSGINVTIGVPKSSVGAVLQYAVSDGVLALPFQWNFSVGFLGGPNEVFGESFVIGSANITAAMFGLTVGLGGLGVGTAMQLMAATAQPAGAGAIFGSAAIVGVVNGGTAGQGATSASTAMIFAATGKVLGAGQVFG